jgi:hypothetical protein
MNRTTGEHLEAHRGPSDRERDVLGRLEASAFAGADVTFTDQKGEIGTRLVKEGKELVTRHLQAALNQGGTR